MLKIVRYILLALLAFAFVSVGITHFTNPDFFIAIVPPYLPAPVALVYISGFFEILGGVGILIPKLRTAAGWGLIALMIAVYPANIHMAMNPDQFPDLSPTALYIRMPIQFVMIAIVWWVTRPEQTV